MKRIVHQGEFFSELKSLDHLAVGGQGVAMVQGRLHEGAVAVAIAAGFGALARPIDGDALIGDRRHRAEKLHDMGAAMDR